MKILALLCGVIVIVIGAIMAWNFGGTNGLAGIIENPPALSGIAFGFIGVGMISLSIRHCSCQTKAS